MVPESGGASYRAVFLAIAVATAGALPAFLTGGLAVQIQEELDFGAAALGLAVALFFLSSAATSALMGRLVERIGASRGMRLAATVSALSLLGVALLARSWPVLVVCLVLGGLANAVSHPAANLSLAREIPPGRLGLSFGIKQAALPAATLLAGLAVPLVAVTFGWRWAFVGGAALALLVALLVPEGKWRGAGRRVDEARRGDAPILPLAVLALGIGLGSTAATPLGAFIVNSAVEEGIRVEAAGLLLATGSACSIAVRVIFGYLADMMSGGRLRLVAGMLAAGVAGFLMLAVGSGALFVAGALVAFGAGWGWPGLFNFAVVKTSPGAPAAATGITQTGASSGAAFGPLLFGAVVEAASYEVAWIVSAAAAFAALAAILTGRALLLGGLPPSLRRG
ncbi:MFS transporter [Rubrobacter xylanophilus]|uniref:MFS transporter n=1 Tax=Rubrobacter xylanophilus TaxID=49319 RepID=UPI001C643EA9|nr:MFS transporter [Rubrobacter xylanophilus]